MSRLIPTPTVDKNGRLTTVHKRSEAASKSTSALSGLRPSMGGAAKTPSAQHTIKPKKIADNSTAVQVGHAMGIFRSDGEVEDFCLASGRKPVTIDDSTLYEFLRRGVDAQSAASLTNLGVENPDDIPGDDDWRFYNLRRVNPRRGSIVYHRSIDAVINRFQSEGVSAVDASKVLENGLQDEHLDQALSDAQLIELFSKWRYSSTCGKEERGHPEQDDVIRGFVSGLIPFELSNHKLNELKGIEYELHQLFVQPFHNKMVKDPIVTEEETALREKLSNDREYLIALADKASTSIEGYNPLREMNRLVEDHGMEVMELRLPQLAGVKIHTGNYQSYKIGVEAARYIETVHSIAESDTDRAYWMSGNRFQSHGGLQVEGTYLRHSNLIELREAGVEPAEAYDLMIKHKLSVEQIKVARETGVSSTLAQGAL